MERTKKGSLVTRVFDELNRSLEADEYLPGSRLPSESQLSATYGVSRPTVRSALRQLESRGLVRTQHGVGTFVSQRPAIHAGLEQMDSITDSIKATGRTPSMVYKNRTVRPLLPDEAERMGMTSNDMALELRRSILADGEIIAYSYDLMPTDILPKDFQLDELKGSIFEFIKERTGHHPHHGVAEIHAVSSEHIGWGLESESHNLYVLLDQLHYDSTDKLLIYSRTYFIEGRYAFSVYRSR